MCKYTIIPSLPCPTEHRVPLNPRIPLVAQAQQTTRFKLKAMLHPFHSQTLKAGCAFKPGSSSLTSSLPRRPLGGHCSCPSPPRAVLAQAQKTRFKLKALYTFSQSNFESRVLSSRGQNFLSCSGASSETRFKMKAPLYFFTIKL